MSTDVALAPNPLPLATINAGPPAGWPKAQVAQFAQLLTAAEGCLPDPRCTPVQLAEAAHLSERTLYRRLRKLTGLTPAAFVRELRLLRARQLLSTGELTRVGEVAFVVGFVNANHFGRVYTRRFGHPPGQDRP